MIASIAREVSLRIVKFAGPIVVATTCYVSVASHGAITTFESRDAWEAAVGDHLTEDFESLDDLSTISNDGGVFSSRYFDILIDANHGRIGPASAGFFGFPTPGLSGTFFVGDVHDGSPPFFNTIRFPEPITAFAANFAAMEEGGMRDIRIAGESFRVVPRNGDGHSRSNFFGVASTTPFTVVDIRNAEDVLERYGMDNVSFRPVPEPGTALLTLLCSAAIIVSPPRRLTKRCR